MEINGDPRVVLCVEESSLDPRSSDAAQCQHARFREESHLQMVKSFFFRECLASDQGLVKVEQLNILQLGLDTLYLG